jgi:hypothetical protein
MTMVMRETKINRFQVISHKMIKMILIIRIAGYANPKNASIHHFSGLINPEK